MNTPFEIGNTYWAPHTHPESITLPCPVCNGAGIVVVLYGGEERVSVECEACRLGYQDSWGTITEYDLSPAAEKFVIAAVQSMYDGRWSLRSETGSLADFHELCGDEETALAVSRVKCAEQHERNMQSHMHSRGSAKRATWTAMYHKKCIVDLEKQIAWHVGRISMQSKKVAL